MVWFDDWLRLRTEVRPKEKGSKMNPGENPPYVHAPFAVFQWESSADTICLGLA